MAEREYTISEIRERLTSDEVLDAFFLDPALETDQQRMQAAITAAFSEQASREKPGEGWPQEVHAYRCDPSGVVNIISGPAPAWPVAAAETARYVPASHPATLSDEDRERLRLIASGCEEVPELTADAPFLLDLANRSTQPEETR